MLQQLKLYYAQSDVNAPGFWIYPAGALLLVYLVALLLAKLRDPKTDNTRSHHALTNLVWAGSIAAAVAGGTGLYYWSSGKFSNQPIQFALLIALLLAYIVSLWSLYDMASRYKSERIKDLARQTYTFSDRSQIGSMLRKQFNQLKLVAWMLPLTAAIALLPVFRQSGKNLLCFVLDNSSSMKGTTSSGMIPLQTGKDALTRTIQNLDENTHIMLSYMDDRTAKKNLPELIAITSAGSLAGVVIPFESNKDEAIQKIQDIDVSSLTPLCEVIWKTFLQARDQIQGQDYNKRYLVVITDAGESLIEDDELNNFMCDHPEFEEVFPSASVRIVKLEDRNLFSQLVNATTPLTGNFQKKIDACGYIVLDGSTLSSYNAAIDQIVEEVKHDFYFPLWILILYVVYGLFVMGINPRQNI